MSAPSEEEVPEDCHEVVTVPSSLTPALPELLRVFGVQHPHEAVQAMLDGLEQESQRHDFRVSMSLFIRSYDAMCIGCAATCALTKLSGVGAIPGDQTRRQHTTRIYKESPARHTSPVFNVAHMIHLESWYDGLRMGDLFMLSLIGVPPAVVQLLQDEADGPGFRGPQSRLYMNTAYWRNTLPLWRQVVAGLKQHGY